MDTAKLFITFIFLIILTGCTTNEPVPYYPVEGSKKSITLSKEYSAEGSTVLLKAGEYRLIGYTWIGEYYQHVSDIDLERRKPGERVGILRGIYFPIEDTERFRLWASGVEVSYEIVPGVTHEEVPDRITLGPILPDEITNAISVP